MENEVKCHVNFGESVKRDKNLLEFFTRARRATALFNDDDDEYLQCRGRSDIAVRAELAFGVSGNDVHFAEGAGEGH